MKSAWFVMLAALFMSGCSEQSSVEKAVQYHLKDPSSAEFRDYIASDGNKYACISWNARNGFGGYTGWEVAYLEKNGDEWGVRSMRHEPCSQEDLNSTEETDRIVEQITGLPK